MPSSCCFRPGGRGRTHILGFPACIDCMVEKRARQYLPMKSFQSACGCCKCDAVEYLQDHTLLCETCSGGCFVCGWSERGVEDGWRVDRNALVSWAWHLRAGPYHARYPRLTFSLEAADRSFIWTAVHQMERERKEERKEGRKEGRKENAGSETCECKRTERSRSRHRYSLFLHVTPAFAAGPALSIRASILLSPVTTTRQSMADHAAAPVP